MTTDLRQLKLVNAIAHEVESLSDEDWMDLAAMTSGESIVRNHLSLDWLDISVDNPTAYYENTKHVIRTLIEQDDSNLKVILDYLRLPDRMKEYDPKQFAELFGRTRLLIDEIRERALYNSFDVNQYVLRIQNAVDDDPELAIGSMKELLESLMKSILVARGETLSGKEDMPDLLKRTQKTLKLSPSDFDSSSRGGELVKRTLSNLGQVVDGIAQLRNLYGTGHGRTRQSGVSPRHARLVVNSGAALLIFLVETFEYHKAAGN